MEHLKRWGIFVLILALVSAGAALLFWDTGSECLSVLGTGRGSSSYLLASADTEGKVYVLGQDREGYFLVLGDQTGARTGLWRLTADGLPRESVPAALYPAAGGAVYLGLYSTEEETCLQLYRLTQQGTAAELLLNEPCPGDNLQTQMAAMKLSSFSQVDGVVTFALMEGDTATFYRRAGVNSGLEEVGSFTQAGLRAAMALSDGTQILACGAGLVRTDGGTIPLTNGEIIIEMAQAGTGVYYLDAAGLNVFFADFANWQPYPILELTKDGYDLDHCTDLTMTWNGDVLLLLDGGTLLLDRGSAVTDLSGMLYPSALRCGLILAGLVLAVLVLTVALWFAVCEQNRFRLPLLLRWGVLAVALAALGTAALIRGPVAASSREAAEREATSLLSALTAQSLQRYAMTDDTLTQSLSLGLASMSGGRYRDSAVTVYMKDGDVWTVRSSNTGLPDGARAELSRSFDRTMAQQAGEQGTLLWSRDEGDHIRYILYRTHGNALLAVDVNGVSLLEAGETATQWMVRGLTALAVLLTALTLAMLCWISLCLRRALKGMERLAAGELDVRVNIGGGDELSSLADDVNALSASLRDLDLHQQELAQSYRRFVPERVLSLLGKTSIQEVDKQTFVSRSLAAMMLWFRFPPQVYEKSGRELFDNLNEIIERTASIVTQKGGAVFNFAYDGYDAVFEGGSAAAVSTAVAVQQEIMEINRERELDGRPPVVVRIALDEGDVMLGVVGDENQIEPTSISSSFSVAKHLVELCGRLEANILCTEAVIRSAQGYGSRYMGKCLEGGAAIRTYEIYDGDAYEIRKVKEDTGERFSEGVYALYGRDFSQAKRIFLSLVHHNTGDGGARYYLYLADRLEKRPEDEISLDSGL